MACSDGGCELSCKGGNGACPSCGNGCSSGCEFCSNSCGDCGGCGKSCDGCSGTCEGCGGACSRSCSGCTGCSGCSGSCTDSCNDGCTASNVTTVYTNLTLQTLIKANDMINLRELVENEVTRRSKTATDVTINVGDKATADTINIIINNLNKVASTQSTTKKKYDIMDKESMLALINIAKNLYTKNIKA